MESSNYRINKTYPQIRGFHQRAISYKCILMVAVKEEHLYHLQGYR